MGRNSLEWPPEELAIIKRRETLSDGTIWPMKEWDYTEWEEFHEEVRNLRQAKADASKNFIKIRDISAYLDGKEVDHFEFIETNVWIGQNNKTYPIGYMKKVLDKS